MPEFHLDTAGVIRDVRAPSIEAVKRVDLAFGDLDAFTQGYIEAAFFTETGYPENGDLEHATFAELAPEALAAAIADCHKFLSTDAWRKLGADQLDGVEEPSDRQGLVLDDARAGRDFWYTRNGHGVGFWDGDWPEPYATQLTAAAKEFPHADMYRGDDGRIYFA